MQGATKLQSEIEKVVLATADAPEALREIAQLLVKLTGSPFALVVRWKDEERGATSVAYSGLSAPLADKLCAELAPYHAASPRPERALNALEEVVLVAPPDVLRPLKVQRLIIAPLHRAGKALGLLVLGQRAKTSGASAVAAIEAARISLVLLIEHAVYLEKISVYSKVANVDGLTGLYTHRYFQETLSKELDRAQRLGHPVSLMMIDIDHFKRHNDAFGHPQGDAALKAIAGVLQRSVRSYDFAARYGGEEMVLVLPQASPHTVLPLAERIRAAVAELPFRVGPDARYVRLTVSIGVAGVPANAKNKAELIERADQALYLAKEEGRNRVGVSLNRSRKSIRFAYCPPALTSSYYADVLTGVRDVIEQLGGIELIVRAPDKESNHHGMTSICRSLIRSGVDAIALAPQSASILPIVRGLNKARVPVFFFNTPRRMDGAQVVTYIGYPQKEAGREVGRYLARMLRGRGSILVLKGLTNTNTTSADRVAGFRAEIARQPQMRIVATRQANWERGKARQVVTGALQKLPIDAIFAVSDEMALGASDAVADAGRAGEIFIVGLDGTRAALQAIWDGSLTATLNTNPREMGRILMRTVVRSLNPRERAEQEITSPINVVARENVAQY